MKVHQLVFNFCNRYGEIEKRAILAEIFLLMLNVANIVSSENKKQNYMCIKRHAVSGAVLRFESRSGELLNVPTSKGIVQKKEFYAYELNGVLYAYDFDLFAMPLKDFKLILKNINCNDFKTTCLRKRELLLEFA